MEEMKSRHTREKQRSFVQYDQPADCLYIGTAKGREDEFTEVAPGINVEVDRKGNVLGVEILNASNALKGFLKSLGKKRDVA